MVVDEAVQYLLREEGNIEYVSSWISNIEN